MKRKYLLLALVVQAVGCCYGKPVANLWDFALAYYSVLWGQQGHCKVVFGLVVNYWHRRCSQKTYDNHPIHPIHTNPHITYSIE